MFTESGQFFTSGGGYEIDQSIIFNDNDSAYLSDTLGTATDTDVYTISMWVKRGNLGLMNFIFSASPVSSTTEDFIGFLANDTIFVRWAGTTRLATTQVFRDPSAWYHVILACDYGAAGSAKAKLYVNGVEITAFTTDTRSSITTTNQRWNTATLHYFGRNAPAGGQYLDGYLSEINFIDGQQLAPTDFGEYNDDGVWIPKEYAGAYGDNGFYLTGATAGDLGEDFSGNNNDFTSSGLTADDQVTDSPTLNYCTLTPLSIAAFTGTFSEGNLRLVVTSNDMQFGTMFPQTGKWFFEVYVTDANNSYLGIVPETNANGEGNSLGYRNGAMLNTNGDIYIPSGAATEDGSPSWGDGVRVGVAYDVDNHLVWWSIDGQWYSANDSSDAAIAITEVEAGNQGYDFSGLGGNGFAPCIAASTTGGDCTLNTGNPTASFIDTTSNSDGNGYGLFADPVPSGFLALNTANLPAPTITDGSANFQTTLYTGNGTAIGSGGLAVSQSENSTFQPDFVWIKKRSGAVEHVLTDAVRGVTKEISSNSEGAEETVAEGLTTFGSAGFTVGSDGSYNTSSATYAAWQWLAGNGTATNEDGSITSTVSANVAAGISVITWTGNGTSGATIGHGLSAAPEFFIVKNRTDSDMWPVLETAIGGGTNYMSLQNTAISNANSTFWTNTNPTSSLITLGTQNRSNGSGNAMVGYAFHSVPNFSLLGAYTGNGNADGSFIHTGFKTAWVMTKRTNSTSAWTIFDNQREGYNVDNDELVANTTAAETTTDYLDLLSNGFKLRSTDADVNASAGTYIYMAFAEHPFGGGGAAPATAR